MTHLDLMRRRHWVFDLDGTLTAHVHDFAGLRRRLGLAEGLPILEALAALPDAERVLALREVHAWERDHLADARPEPDAVALVAALADRGARLGILTRNTAATALETLRRVGLLRWFTAADVLGRDSAPAKPAPDGVRLLLARWGAPPDDGVMVGDWAFDIDAGRAAGVATVLVDRAGEAPSFADRADVVVRRLDELLAATG